MRVLFFPRIEPGAGSGHLRRCQRLARAHGPGAELMGQGSPEALQRGAGPWDLVVLDRRASTVGELERFLPLPVLAIDEGGAAREFASYLIDSPLNPPRGGAAARRPPNLRGLSLLELPEHRGCLRLPFRRVLLSFGGEDAAELSGALLAGVLRRGLLAPGQLTVVEGPCFRRRSWPAGVEVLRPDGELKDLLHRYDLLISSWGLTTLEALAAGVPVVNFNPTRYHRGLSRVAGVPEIGVGRPALGRLRRLLADARTFQRLRQRYGAEALRRGADEPEAGPGYLPALRPLAKAGCPVCGRLLNPAAARFARRTYFRCRDCGVLYLMRFGGEPRSYDRRYFFEEYQLQYGRTYLEDFQSIKAAAHLRLAAIDRLRGLCGGRAGAAEKGRLLDVGCALGPFLQAAAEAGYRAEGTDVSEDAARHVREQLGLPCRVEDFEATEGEGFAEGSFDVVSLWYVVEHFRDPAAALRRAYRLLRPGGVLALATPSASGISARRSLRGFLERSPLDHVTVWPAGAAAGILRRLGFRLRRLIVTGHHAERFPGAAGVRAGSAGARLLESFSRFAGLGDTFEAYAVRLEAGASK